MLQQQPAKPANDAPPDSGLTENAGHIGGRYAQWMSALDVDTPAAVSAMVEAAGISPLVDTRAQADQCDYDRPEGEDAYLTLHEDDARTLLNQSN